MKILLIRPPLTITNPYQLENMPVGLPLGLLYIGAVLEKGKFRVEIFDGLVHFDLAAKRDLFKSKVKSRSFTPVHFGAEWDQIKRHIAGKKPDIVGITNHFTEEVEMAFKTARLAKEVDRKILTIIGGPFASTCPEEILRKEKDLDIAAMGEGEYALPEIAAGKNFNEIEGIAYRGKGDIIVNRRRPYIRDLDSLPFPAYHLVEMERYFHFQESGYATRRQTLQSRKVPIITSRGCPFNCTFCSIHLHMGRIWRPHSPEYVMRHIDFLIKNYRAEHILFEDDSINLDSKRFEKILDAIISSKYRILWDTPNGVRADKLNETLIRKAKQSGCLFLKIGIESGDQYVVNKIVKKHLDLDKVIEAAKLCRELGMGLQAFFIIGFPGETKKEIKRTVNFSLKLFKRFNVVSALGPAKPLIGTELRRECIEKGYLTQPLETMDMKERLIARQEMIATPEFDLEYLFRVIRRYELRRRIITLEKVFASCISRPGGVFRRILSLINKTIKTPSGINMHLKDTFNEIRREFGLI